MSDSPDPLQKRSTPPKTEANAGSGGGDPPQVTAKEAAHFLTSNLPAVGGEMADLLGTSIVFEGTEAGWMDRNEILEQMQGRRLLCHVDVLGETNSCGYMLWPINDAISFSGALLMAARGAIAENIRKQEMSEDWLDAFGEIVNIFIGGYSNRMKSQYPLTRSLRKASVEVVDPDHLQGISGESPIPEGLYFCLSTRLDVERQTRGPLLFFFPVEALGLATPDPEQLEVGEDEESAEDIAGQYASLNLDALVVVLGDAPNSVSQVVRALKIPGIDVLQAGQGYDITEYLTSSELNCVFLVVSSINPPILVRAGKVRALLSASCALILAGHDWTREYVVKAKKEGIDDILVLPTDDAAIREKCLKFLGNFDNGQSVPGTTLSAS